MSYSRFTRRMALLVALLLAVAPTFIQSKPSSYYYNLLTINGKPLDYALFSIRTKGILALVAGNSETANAPKIPFRVYLRRGNLPINGAGSIPGRSVSEIEVSQVLAAAKPGDFLVIEPARQEDARAVRIIKLTDYIPVLNCKWVFPYWLFGPRKSDGC